jgi:hypothetical protein
MTAPHREPSCQRAQTFCDRDHVGRCPARWMVCHVLRSRDCVRASDRRRLRFPSPLPSPFRRRALRYGGQVGRGRAVARHSSSCGIAWLRRRPPLPMKRRPLRRFNRYPQGGRTHPLSPIGANLTRFPTDSATVDLFVSELVPSVPREWSRREPPTVLVATGGLEPAQPHHALQ